ncbi:MAG: HD domain-containing protein [Patescibacteria group bacterium]
MKAKTPLLNKRNIKAGKLADLIPEFYDLKNVVENNHWHNHENVFDHSLSVLENLEKMINKIKMRRKNLLKIAALFHDIAKKETIVIQNDFTICPKHEDVGAAKVRGILKRFDLGLNEIEFVASIVKSHGLIHAILTPGKNNFAKEIARLRKKKIYRELILLSYADTIGSYLKKTKPAEFKYRIDFYKQEVKNF